ncbi:MAG TPA: GWxTD domain-containing protein [Gemmatimonadaceae bacterium]|nr:GWxTD domain-containing protein [Gemmatimonadaceae bacterium]
MTLLAAFLVAACSGGKAGPSPAPAPGRAPARAPGAAPGAAAPSSLEFDGVKLYRELGLLARGTPMPFVGNVAFMATSSPDSTHVVVAVTIANGNLTFGRETDRFRAGYTVSITLRNGAETVKQVEAHESVLVASYKEVSRLDESVIYQELLTVKPGRYSLTLNVRDDGSSKNGSDDVTLVVPTLGAGSLSTPMAFAQVTQRLSLDSLPRIVTNPAATATFGRDSLIGLYLEGYGNGAGRLPLNVAVRTETGRMLFSDTVSIAHRQNMYSGVLYVPIARTGIGPFVVSVWQTGMNDTTRSPLFVGFGEELPVATYDEMINYLRWFALPPRLKSLRDTAPEFRPAAWANFVRENASQTGGSEALRDYFLRINEANTQFREEGVPGWMTDRGKVLLGLGEPDQRYQQGLNADPNNRLRSEIWEYRSLQLQLVFSEQQEFGHWRLTNSSAIAFDNAWRRRLTR